MSLRVLPSAPRGIVLGLVATHLLNHHIVDVYTRIATRACAGDKVGDVETSDTDDSVATWSPK